MMVIQFSISGIVMGFLKWLIVSKYVLVRFNVFKPFWPPKMIITYSKQPSGYDGYSDDKGTTYMILYILEEGEI